MKIYTLGCRANQYQSEVLKTSIENDADAYVVNTCAVTADAARKSRQAIRRALRESRKVIVTGCYAKLGRDFLSNKFPTVEIRLPSSFSSHFPLPKPRVRTNLMIQDGCEHFCSYCVVPYARGEIKIKPIEEVVKEAGELVAAGAREIVLTGINLAAYGKELINVIEKLTGIENLLRLRLSSLEPMYLDRKLIDVVAANPRVCRHLHLPLQSGDDSILAAMNRSYSRNDYGEFINYIRSKIPDCGLTTDIIVGFPGEGEREFRNTVDLIEKIKFSRLHIFSYSKRKGTPAAGFPNQVDAETRKRRSRTLRELGKRQMIEFAARYLNKEVEILVEQKGEGLTSNYIRVYYPGSEEEIGCLKNVIAKETGT